ncbi:hypothetical protein OVY01_13265 [Robbsia sp. Bb-Pol-6]|uniref:Uncharacterized protein n=1 Tax=Robbsia betulipollinis TaxID=2981849 RepID=A0ABT3ZNS4_9BURK|nr:hypothetical protein [Robbsia betulipollinis]MCY0388189.1 hypothetical protein [Robbsia betulipollinis]
MSSHIGDSTPVNQIRILVVECAIKRFHRAPFPLEPLGRVVVQDISALVDLAQSANACRSACGVANEFGAGLLPTAGSRAKPIAFIAGQPGFGVRVVFGAAGDAFEQTLQNGWHDREWGAVHGGRRVQSGGPGLGMLRADEPVFVVRQRHAGTVPPRAIGRHPRIREARRLEDGFDAGAARSVHIGMEVHQLPKWCADAARMHIGRAPVGRWWCGVLTLSACLFTGSGW